MVDSLQRPTISSLETMLIEANNHLRPWYCFSLTKSSLKRTFSCSVEIMSADKLTESTDSMMNARDDTVSASGKNSRTFSTACQLQPSSTTRYYVCMEVCHLNSSQWRSCNRLRGQLKYPRMDSCAIYSGLIQRRPKVAGEKMTEVSAILSEKR